MTTQVSLRLQHSSFATAGSLVRSQIPFGPPRGGDASTGWLTTDVKALGATTTHIALALVPLMLAWAWLATVLARQEKRRSVAP